MLDALLVCDIRVRLGGTSRGKNIPSQPEAAPLSPDPAHAVTYLLCERVQASVRRRSV